MDWHRSVLSFPVFACLNGHKPGGLFDELTSSQSELAGCSQLAGPGCITLHATILYYSKPTGSGAALTAPPMEPEHLGLLSMGLPQHCGPLGTRVACTVAICQALRSGSSPQMATPAACCWTSSSSARLLSDAEIVGMSVSAFSSCHLALS